MLASKLRLQAQALNVHQRLTNIISSSLSPAYLNIINQSKMHSRGDQTHFKVIIVSEELNQIKPRVKQHQRVLKLTKELMDTTTLHSVSLQVVPRVEDVSEEMKISPTCAGGHA